MGNLSIYLNEEQQKKLDSLTEKGLSEDFSNRPTQAPVKRNRSTLIATLIEQAHKRLIEAEMIADAIAIDRENLGWNEAEESCQIIDSEQSGL